MQKVHLGACFEAKFWLKCRLWNQNASLSALLVGEPNQLAQACAKITSWEPKHATVPFWDPKYT